MKSKSTNRFLAVVMALAMTLSLLPVQLFGGNVKVEAAETVYTLTPDDIPDASKAAPDADGNVYITSGTFNTAFQLDNPDNKWRWYSDRLDGGKSNKCKLVYTVQDAAATATLEISISAAGSNKNSAITLVDGTGTPVAMSDGNTTITLTESAPVTLKWENLSTASGPYTLASAGDKMRVYSVTATETASSQPVVTDYTLVPDDIPDASKAAPDADGNVYITSGTYKTAFQLDNPDNKWRWYSDRLDGGKSNKCKLVYTVQDAAAKATLEISISAAGSNKNSVITLVDGAGTPVAMSDGNTSITLTESAPVTLKWENLSTASGPYTLASAGDKMRIYSVKASETVDGSVISGTAPVVGTVSATEPVDGKTTISWTTTTAGTGDAVYNVYVSSDNGATYTSVKKKVALTESSVEYTLKASGTYIFKVVGALGADENAGATSAALAFTLPLATPKPSASNAGDGAVNVSWGKVAEATSYDVNVYEGTNLIKTVNTAELTVTIDGLTNGTEYGFTVTAKRSDTDKSVESEVVKATPVAIKGDFKGFYPTNMLEAGEITANKTIDDTWSILTDGSKLTVKANDTEQVSSDGYKFSKRIQTEGSGDFAIGKRLIKLVVTEPSYVVVYATTSGAAAANRTLVLADEAGEELNRFPLAAKDSTLNPSVAYNLEAGTYYFYSTGGSAYIFGIYLDKGVAPRGPWDKVPNPEITSLTRNDDGTISVDFTGKFGSNGADMGYVFMYQNGLEVASQIVTAQETVKFTPSTEGDFDFKVVLCRKGEADKESEIKTLTGYKLPLTVPTITWVDNLGDGSVYVDWNNIGADEYEILVKSEADAEYTSVEAGFKTANYTLNNLIDGAKYDIKVIATKDGLKSESTASVTVGPHKQQWYIAAIGSATSGKMTVAGTEYDVKTATGVTEVPDVTNTDGTVKVNASDNGKIADSEDGFFYYYTKVNPNKEHFKLTATFTVVDTSLGPDNQTGYAIYATDIAGYGSKDAKYFNSVSVGQVKMFQNGYHAHGARLITGYQSYDASNNAGAIRNLNNTNVIGPQNIEDTVNVGDTFTYTLEKTDAGYVASMVGGQSYTFEGATSIMAQEDGSICVGVAVARKVGVEISNIKFETTPGGASGSVEEQIIPKLNIYSSGTSGRTDYEFIASPNVGGWLDVYDTSMKIVYQGYVEADKVVKVPFELTNMGGYNTFKYAFAPDPQIKNLTSYMVIDGLIDVMLQQWGEEGETIYTAPNAGSGAAGTMEDPLDLQTALNHAQPGQRIVMLDGTYYINKDLVIGRSVNGKADNPIVLMALNDGKAIVDGSRMEKSSSLISVVGSYWHLFGIEFTNGLAKGISVCGNHNTVELCNIYKVGNSGLQISRYAGEPNDQEMWPTGNLVKNCTAHDCCDPGRNDADGFAAKLTCGEGNKFYGCISHNNIDDGWDLYAKSTTGPIGAVTIENCVAYSNGFLSNEDPKTTDPKLLGEGNGFKLGGENMPGAHVLKNCISYNNYAKGITSNSGPDCQVYLCTAYNNSLKGNSYNVSLYTKTSNPKAWVLDGMLSVAENGTTSAELGASNGVIYSLRSSSNYLFDGSSSMNNQGVQATSDWFISTDISVQPTRFTMEDATGAEGSVDNYGAINMHGLLELKSTAPTDTGARLNTTGIAKSVKPAITKTVSTKKTAQIIGGIVVDPTKPKGVKTGDTSPIIPLMAATVVSAGICGAYIFRRKKEDME